MNRILAALEKEMYTNITVSFFFQFFFLSQNPSKQHHSTAPVLKEIYSTTRIKYRYLFFSFSFSVLLTQSSPERALLIFIWSLSTGEEGNIIQYECSYSHFFFFYPRIPKKTTVHVPRGLERGGSRLRGYTAALNSNPARSTRHAHKTHLSRFLNLLGGVIPLLLPRLKSFP